MLVTSARRRRFHRGVYHLTAVIVAVAVISSRSNVVVVASNSHVRCPSSSSSSSSSSFDEFGNNYNDDALNTRWNPEYDTTLMSSCDVDDENAHGIYASNLAPCEIAFHKYTANHNSSSNNNQGDEEEEEGNSNNGFHLLSNTACQDSNRIALSGTKTKSLLQYVSKWKDECVGDFTRCYSLVDNKEIYLTMVCRKKWIIPDDATHISVNCTKDKQLKLAKFNEAKNQYNEQYNSMRNDPGYSLQEKALDSQNNRWHEMEALMAMVLIVLVLSCFGFAFTAYCCMIKPYMSYSRVSKQSELEDFIHSSKHDDDDHHQTSNNMGHAQMA